ncbi:MAG: hypothetical protein MI785_03880 [Kiloniellales bacterium]|nr:hypothetical protein [Kiloniellales bacterium]
MPEDLRWNAATLWAGPRCHIVHYPLKGWEVFNLVVTCHDDAEDAVAGRPVAVAEVRRGFTHVGRRARQIIEHGEGWRLWVLCDRDPIVRWVEGRVALLGDAAHPMLQYFAQGACLALEDAVCLGHNVEAFGGALAPAFAAYCEQQRSGADAGHVAGPGAAILQEGDGLGVPQGVDQPAGGAGDEEDGRRLRHLREAGVGLDRQAGVAHHRLELRALGDELDLGAHHPEPLALGQRLVGLVRAGPGLCQGLLGPRDAGGERGEGGERGGAGEFREAASIDVHGCDSPVCQAGQKV